MARTPLGARGAASRASATSQWASAGPAAWRCGYGEPPSWRAPTHPDFRTSAPRERRSGSQSPRTSRRRRAHARMPARSSVRSPRAHGTHAPAHSPAPHTPASPAPPLCQEAAGSRTPLGPHPRLLSPHHHASHRHQGSETSPARSPRCQHRTGRRGPGASPALRTHGAPGPGHEARRKGRRRAWGWHSGSHTGAPTLTRVPHPSPRRHLCSTKGCRKSGAPRPTYRSSRVPPGSSLAGGRRPRSQGRARRGAAAPRCGQRPPA